ncbi:MAG: transposase, partial [bacterium]
DLPHELEKIGQLYQWIYENLYSTYAEFDIFKIFERVYHEHFTVVEEKITVKSSDQLHSGCVQSPDDVDASYRDKNGKTSKGQAINVTETAHPDNPINLVTDVVVNPNNIDDSQVLGERLDRVKQKTPDLDELHFDGGYGSSDNDEKFAEYGITPIQTAVRGRQAAVTIEIEQVSDDEYKVSCRQQTVTSQPTRNRHKAEFDLKTCHQCPHRNQCSAINMKKYSVFYFSREDYLARRRQNRIHEIPKERRTLRNNVEATVKEFVCKMPRKKLKVRGAFKAEVFAYSMAISVNFGRIYRLILDDPEYFKAFFFFIFKIANERVNFMRFLYRLWILQLILKATSVSTLPPKEKWRVETRCF